MTQPATLEALDPADVRLWADFLAALDAEAGEQHDQPKRTRQAMFASAWVATFDRGTALRVAGVTHHTHTKWRTEPAFRALCEAAEAQIRERVAGEVYRRAVVGVEQGVWHQGRLVGTETKYSDRLLELIAKRIDPAWSERVQAASAESSASSLVARILASEELRAKAIELAEAAQARPAAKVIDVEPTRAIGTGGSAAE